MDGQGRLFTYLFLFLTLTACGPNGPKRWESFPITIYSDVSIANSAEARADLMDAMAFWENHAGQRLFDYRGGWVGRKPYEGTPNDPKDITANVIFFLDPWDFASNVAGHTVVMSRDDVIEGSLVMINPDIHFCARDCSGNTSQTSQRKVFAHELGHFIGLNHIDDTRNIMNPGAMPGGALFDLQVDEKALSEVTD